MCLCQLRDKPDKQQYVSARTKLSNWPVKVVYDCLLFVFLVVSDSWTSGMSETFMSERLVMCYKHCVVSLEETNVLRMLMNMSAIEMMLWVVPALACGESYSGVYTVWW